MANLDFKKDLILGNEGEQVIIDFLKKKGLIYVESNNDNKFDLKMIKNGVSVDYEVKTDVLCSPKKDTGNMFIEFKCRNKASGIETTKAEWFVTYFKHLNEAWFIKTNKLKALLANKDNYFRIIETAGDVGSNTHGYLVNRKKYKEHFHVCEI